MIIQTGQKHLENNMDDVSNEDSSNLMNGNHIIKLFKEAS